ncbi:DUF1836 domain-containing protein [Ornithinibacillus halophilus]|uniref:DUF1836 domain-containing protein n=1 Tax=Ornithinibacillus halophilus TaxID=930117 RepID=A0A1M5F5X7_9BACI|nr:DUF1836 domain-containing protein [Ornithinibacillus halophilus]SHF86788.1 protein of unknown function [Ornithinibacillus halophilus]
MIDDILDELQLENQLKVEDIPDLELYMDQVIQLFERTFASSKRNDDEKVLTKTMINNYAKGKLFFPIKNKKYSKEHILLISMIYQLKGALSIKDIKTTLEQLNGKIENKEIELEDLYQHFLRLSNNNIDRFTEDSKVCSTEVKIEANQLNGVQTEYIEQLLLVSSFVQMSNLYRRAAERLVDEIANTNHSEE